jgi:hypothetical protein
VKRIESLPLNGRQFANLAATVPGVGLSFHSDPTKSTQYAPLVNGGAGRNINYQIDGGDRGCFRARTASSPCRTAKHR